MYDSSSSSRSLRAFAGDDRVSLRMTRGTAGPDRAVVVAEKRLPGGRPNFFEGAFVVYRSPSELVPNLKVRTGKFAPRFQDGYSGHGAPPPYMLVKDLSCADDRPS